MDDDAAERRCAAVDEAMSAWGDAVYRLAYARLRNRADAEDVMQTVFLRLLRRDEPFVDEGHEKAWLLRVTANCCNDLHRSAWSRHRAAGEDLPDLVAIDDGALRDVWEAVGSLPESQRDVVHLRCEEGYEVDEIAEILGVKPATVRVRLHRARKALRTMLGGSRGHR
ncbi:RNA polymerase subunit sigma-24 [Gordonibacter sp. 28C]|uniref:RNA polymerase sigma factor n=1 Tax=Gordonibacter sp. 28C TaxID=2078569 RepID=UPI000DF836E7|nr:sigma-70 family RNA polymerase sigma factor [Gordonibacter sp. 28C]RDB63227.1 RNA polymerase subunit sigma-24 [Gordonibacter sp. 28C]